MNLFTTDGGEITPGFPRVSGDEPSSGMRFDRRIRFPRVSGDEPPTAVLTPLEIAFSPRERG